MRPPRPKARRLHQDPVASFKLSAIGIDGVLAGGDDASDALIPWDGAGGGGGEGSGEGGLGGIDALEGVDVCGVEGGG